MDSAVRKKLGVADGPILFRHLKVPLKVVAGDLLSGKIRVFGGDSDGDLNAIDAALASASYPLFFKPFSFNGSLFVDGGLLSNLPAWVFDDERLRQTRPIPTLGFRFVEVPLLGRSPLGKIEPPASFPAFFKRLADTSIFGGQALSARAIDDYYAFDLAADIDTLAFHEIRDKAAELVDAGRKGVANLFDSQLGPTDPDKMETILAVIANFLVQALDKSARQKLSPLRIFVLIETSQDFIKVAYSANAIEDADDRLKIRSSSPGTAECLKRKEPVLTFVPQISTAIRTSPLFKYEHASRPSDVVTVYAIPIFKDPREWDKERPAERSNPIAALLIDSPDDIRYLLRLPEFEDRITTYAQICGEYLRGTPVEGYEITEGLRRDASELDGLAESGFFVSSRKPRALFQDDETVQLVERIEKRIRPAPGPATNTPGARTLF